MADMNPNMPPEQEDPFAGFAEDDPFDFGDQPAAKSSVPRDTPQPPPARAALVTHWAGEVSRARTHWKASFDRMKEDADFTFGRQWDKSDDDDRYVANVTLRHVQQRTASLYAKNPKAIARVRPKLDAQIWDGTQASLQQAVMLAQSGDPQSVALIQEVQLIKQKREMMRRLSRTLELLYDYQIDEQSLDFKAMLKLTVRRAVTKGVGYVRLGFQRVMALHPGMERSIADMSERLAEMERLASDLADKEISPDDKEAEQLRLQIEAMKKDRQIIVREGLQFDYPDSHCIIPDTNCKQLATFLGCDWVAEEYHLTRAEIQRIYGIDVGNSFTQFRAYSMPDGGTAVEQINFDNWGGDKSDDKSSEPVARVCEIYSKTENLVYVICEGYPDFLSEPAAPPVYTERFWPWFPLVLNEVTHESEIYPKSDVRLIRDMQMEINRARQGLREHRVANRPKYAVAAGTLDQGDIDKLKNHPANAVLELNGLQPGQNVGDLIQPFKLQGIDQNLYATQPSYEDMMRTVGVQEANLGGTSNSTATESSIAESSRQTSQASNIDDLDTMLSQIARASSQIMLLNMTKQIVTEIVGPGAVWPTLTKADVAKEVYLEIQAGSSGRPNRAQEVSNMEKLLPFLLQIPEVSPKWVMQQILTRMDESLDIEDAMLAGLPSIASMNALSGRNPGQGGGVPAAQGSQGSNNSPKPPQPGRPTAGAPDNPGVTIQ